MDAATAARFQAGAGIEAGVLRETADLLAGLAALLWAAWAIEGLYRRWRAGDTDLLGLFAGIARATVLALLVLYFLNP